MTDLTRISGLQSAEASRDDVMRACGYAVILLSVATALLPAGKFRNGPEIVGALMIAVGLFELLANALRAKGRWGTMAAGCASVAAGVLVFFQPATNFMTTVYLFGGWLVARGSLLLLSTIEAKGSSNRALLIAACVDFFLAALVWVGLTASMLVIALFGPTAPVIANFAWLVAISFVGSGLLLIRLAND